jgi:erythronate-4-phosphate dehydrogenase
MILDVWNKEPEIDEELRRMTELSTAHIAGYSTDGKANGTMMSVRKLSAFFLFVLDDWKPGSMPSPENPSVVIDCQGMEEKEIIRAVHAYSYDIEEDSRLLRESPAAFEHIRGSYRIRREEKAYSVKLINNPWTGLPGVLEEMGFSVLETDCFC